MSPGLHHSSFIEVWNVCVIGYDYLGANSFRKVCIIVCNLGSSIINFLVVESEWVDTVVAEQSPYPGWSFCHSGLIFELWMTCFCLSWWCLFCCFMWIMLDYFYLNLPTDWKRIWTFLYLSWRVYVEVLNFSRT